MPTVHYNELDYEPVPSIGNTAPDARDLAACAVRSYPQAGTYRTTGGGLVTVKPDGRTNEGYDATHIWHRYPASNVPQPAEPGVHEPVQNADLPADPAKQRKAVPPVPEPPKGPSRNAPADPEDNGTQADVKPTVSERADVKAARQAHEDEARDAYAKEQVRRPDPSNTPDDLAAAQVAFVTTGVEPVEDAGSKLTRKATAELHGDALPSLPDGFSQSAPAAEDHAQADDSTPANAPAENAPGPQPEAAQTAAQKRNANLAKARAAKANKAK